MSHRPSACLLPLALGIVVFVWAAGAVAATPDPEGAAELQLSIPEESRTFTIKGEEESWMTSVPLWMTGFAAVAGALTAFVAFLRYRSDRNEQSRQRKEQERLARFKFMTSEWERYLSDPEMAAVVHRVEAASEDLRALLAKDPSLMTGPEYLERSKCDRYFEMLERFVYAVELGVLKDEDVRYFRWHFGQIIDHDFLALYCDRNGYSRVTKFARDQRFTNRPAIRPMESREQDEVLRIASGALGRDYLTSETLKSVETLVAVRDDEVVGFCTGRPLDGATLSTLQLNHYTELKSATKVGQVGSIAVVPRAQRRGVAGNLLEECLRKLKRDGCDAIVMIAWHSARGIPIAPLARKFSFKRIADISEYWKEASEKDGFACPECGDPPCSCSAVIFVRSAGTALTSSQPS